MSNVLVLSQAQFDAIDASLKRISVYNRSPVLKRMLGSAADIVKRRVRDKIEPPRGYPGDVITDLPLREALKRRTMQWEDGNVTALVTYDYKTQAKHGHLVEDGHIVTPTKRRGPKGTGKPKVPGRRSEWRQPVPYGSRTIAKKYIENAAKEKEQDVNSYIDKWVIKSLAKEGT